MEIQAKIHITKEYIYVYGKLGQQPVKVKNKLRESIHLFGCSFIGVRTVSKCKRMTVSAIGIKGNTYRKPLITMIQNAKTL